MPKRDIETEPTPEILQDVYNSVQTFWPAQFKKDKELIKLADSTHVVTVPDTTEVDRRRKIQPERMESREGPRIVNQIRSLYTVPAPIMVEWSGDTKPKSQIKAEKISRSINEVINLLNPLDDSPLKRERYWMVTLGRAARMIVPGDAYYWDFPEFKEGSTVDERYEIFSNWRRDAPLPLLWKDLLPQNTFPPTFGRMKQEVISWLDLSWNELEEVFSEKELEGITNRKSDFGRDEGDAYRLLTFSNVKWLSYGVTNKDGSLAVKLRNYEHGLGRPAIRILPGMTSGIKQPGKYWQSVLEDVRSLIPQVDRRLSEAATASKFDSLPLFKQWLNQGSDAEGMSKFFEGDIIPLQQQVGEQPKEDIEPLFSPQFGEKTLMLAQFGLARIERISGAVESLEGAFGPSGQPAWSRNFAVEIAKAKFSELTDAVVASDVDAGDSIMRAVKAFGELVKVAPLILLDPADMSNFRVGLKGEYKIRVPVNKRADWDLGMSMMERARQAGLPLSPATIMAEFMDIQDPFREYEDTLVWDFLLSPQIKELYQNRLVKELEGDLADAEGMDIEEFLEATKDWPDELRQPILQEVLGVGAGGNGAAPDIPGAGGVTAETAGAVRAESPGSVRPGGPTPEDRL